MPHINSRGGSEDLASTDEVKVYNDEGAEEIEQRSSEKFLSEDKLGLVKETEQDKSSVSGRGFQVATKSSAGSGGGGEDKSIGPPPTTDQLNRIGYFYRPYANGAASLTASGKVPAVGFQHHPGLMTYGDIMTQPPPAHSGIQVVPAMHIGYKAGLPHTSLFPIPASGQYSVYPDFVPGWPGAAGYAMPPVGGFHAAAPYMHYMAAAAVAGGLLPPHPSLSPHSPVGLPQSALIGQGLKQDSPLQHHVYDAAAVAAAAATRFSNSGNGSGPGGSPAGGGSSDQPAHGSGSRHHPDSSSTNQMGGGSGGGSSSLGAPGQPSPAEKKARVHIKKPLNAFMLFMKEMRSSVVSECTLKESAAINQILGRKWHQLDRAQQAKYYDMAKKEREQHMKLYPGWSARDNYAMHSKKKKKQQHQHIKEAGRSGAASSSSSSQSAACSVGGAATVAAASLATAGLDGGDTGKECVHPKKCRARFGLDKQSHWCKPCRRKKKCVIQHLSDAQVRNGSGVGRFDSSLSDDNDVSGDAADNYHSQATSANDQDDSNGDDLVMDHDDDDDDDVYDDDGHRGRGEAGVGPASAAHQLSTQRSRALASAAAAGSAAATALAAASASVDRMRRDAAAGQEQGQEL